MKKIIFLFVMGFLFAFSVLNAQWNLLDPLPQNNTLYSVFFADAVNGWAVGQWGTIIKTSDRGANWISQASGLTSNLNSIHFVNSNMGWIAGSFGRILRTSNGGIDWNLYQHFRYLSLHSIFFTSENNGWVACEGGILLKTTNGGIEWLEQQVDSYRVLRSVYFIDSDKGWISGDGGLILKTTNGGADWTTQTSGTTSFLDNIFFTDESNGWVNVRTKILRTTDGGTNWTEYSYGVSSYSMSSIYFTDVNTGWVGGSFGAILKTSDGGKSWIEQTSGLSGNGFNGFLNSVYFINAVEGWGVGDSGQMLKTTNGGGAGGGEPEQRVVLDEKFDGAQFPPNGWTVNQTHQTNTWMAGNITDHNFSSIDPTNVNSAICPWIAADQNEWLITPSFALASGTATVEFYAGYSTDWLAYATLKLQISTNGGTNWTQIWEAVNDGQPWSWRYQNVDITQYANNPNMKLAWQYVGNDGDATAIDNVKLTGFVNVTDVKEENEKIPSTYELSQNYPNPFNPTTKINYSIPISSKVSLIVYDILGREVKTLVNQEQHAGTYTVDFNAEGLSSGVYLYRITTGQFSETRKLILLR